jgi:hypothetical protein
VVLGLRWRSSNQYSRNAVLCTALYRKMEDQFGKSWPHSASLSRRQMNTHKHTRTHTHSYKRIPSKQQNNTVLCACYVGVWCHRRLCSTKHFRDIILVSLGITTNILILKFVFSVPSTPPTANTISKQPPSTILAICICF